MVSHRCESSYGTQSSQLQIFVVALRTSRQAFTSMHIYMRLHINLLNLINSIKISCYTQDKQMVSRQGELSYAYSNNVSEETVCCIRFQDKRIPSHPSVFLDVFLNELFV